MAGMIDHRELQRCLFRAQMDGQFAQALHAGDSTALESTRLGQAEFALFQQASLAGISADPGQTRRLQMLGNATLEYRLSLVAAADPRGAIDGFVSSSEFHDAVRNDASLALAAGEYLDRCLAEQFWAHALCRLELALARARREAIGTELLPNTWRCAQATRIVELPAGCLQFAAELREAIDQQASLPVAPHQSGENELVLCAAHPAEARWKLASAKSEVISAAIDELFRFLESPRDKAQLDQFAQQLGANFADLKPVLDEYRAEGAIDFGGET